MEVDGAMKVENTTVFLGDNTRRERNSSVVEEKSSGQNIFAGNLKKQFDPIAGKKQEARKQAMKIVGDAWEGERKIDDDLASRSAKIVKYRETLRKAWDELKEIESRRSELRENYGVEADSEEEENLKLLEKELAAKKIGSGIHLTKEEAEEERIEKQNEKKKEIKKIVDEMKLLEEDIKGAAVDTTVG